MKNKPEQTQAGITEENVECALKKAHNWKSPGIDKIPKFWLYYLNTAHKKIAKELQEMVNDPTKIPAWVTQEWGHRCPKKLQTIYMSSHYLQTVDIYSDKYIYSFLEKN